MTRSYFKRTVDGDHMTLIPLKDKDKLEIGDEIEVHLSIRSKHAMEYVHVRDQEEPALNQLTNAPVPLEPRNRLVPRNP